MKILINDYCGHPFQFDLSIELSTRGHQVLHMYTSASGGPKAVSFGNISNLELVDIKMPDIEKQNFLKRWGQESEYGRKAVEVFKQFEPDVIISANTPLATQRKIIRYCLNNNIKFILWLQDIISVAAKSILKKKLGFIGRMVGAVFQSIEKKILSQSDYIVTIADDFVDTIQGWSIDESKATVIPNWSPIEQIPVLDKSNNFSKENDLDEKFVILYSGTMGMKHNPHIISKAAENLKNHNDIVFVVITDGIGMEVLQEEKGTKNLDNLLLLPFQPFEIFPQVLATGELLLTLLEEDAGVFSVPSKVWSGYCAARPSLLVMPKENLAAKRTIEIDAGIVIPNDDSDSLSEKILELKNDPERCRQYGKNARRFAEVNFRIEKIADRFETIINHVTN